MTTAESIESEADRVSNWFDQYGGVVRGYLRGLVRRDDVAEDLTQDVFRRAWQARGNYQEQGTPRAYLLRIADRLVIDRARKKRPEVSLDDTGWVVAEPQDAGPAPSSGLMQNEARRQLDTAMKLLTTAQRRVLLLRFYGDMSFAEIAETLECPLSTALSHCRRGLLALREIIPE
ncbi:MAG: RNA polymerase sigma factor [Planctomycetaceae bacterium]|nr:RNA polymerase sigma factor [Planctomycetales bacterium]MCB9925659.1 RNA polymerase sigma factor [Planctomycetaceae bacterium]